MRTHTAHTTPVTSHAGATAAPTAVLPLHRVAGALVLAAYAASVGFQIYRATRGTGLDVDTFDLRSGVFYAVLVGLGATLLTDARWAWWANGVVSALVLVQAPFFYYPLVADARPMDVWDWVEGTWFTGLLMLVVTIAVVRLTGWRVVRG